MFDPKQNTLLIVSETPISFDGTQYLHSPSEGRYIDGLAKGFEQVLILTYAFRPGDEDYANTATYRFQSPNIRVIEVPLARHGRFFKIRKFWQMWQSFLAVLRNLKGWDIAYVFFPGYIGAIATQFYRRLKRPYMVYLGSDWPEEAELLIPFQGPSKRVLLPVFHSLVTYLQDTAVMDSVLTFTAGRVLSGRYSARGAPAYETIPRLMWDEFRVYERTDTCTGPSVNLLIVANLIERKGVAYVVDAVRLLRERTNRDFRCSIVGWGPMEEPLKAQIRDAGLEGIVKLTGHLAGTELANCYREADIFVFASFSGEGFPRVLYEAMSQGLPIAATDICGISLKLQPRVHASFVPTKSASGIADAVLELVDDAELRRSLIANGLAFMKAMISGPRAQDQVLSMLEKKSL